jgi:hypothetical protein
MVSNVSVHRYEVTYFGFQTIWHPAGFEHIKLVSEREKKVSAYIGERSRMDFDEKPRLALRKQAVGAAQDQQFRSFDVNFNQIRQRNRADLAEMVDCLHPHSNRRARRFRFLKGAVRQFPHAGFRHYTEFCLAHLRAYGYGMQNERQGRICLQQGIDTTDIIGQGLEYMDGAGSGKRANAREETTIPPDVVTHIAFLNGLGQDRRKPGFIGAGPEGFVFGQLDQHLEAVGGAGVYGVKKRLRP